MWRLSCPCHPLAFGFRNEFVTYDLAVIGSGSAGHEDELIRGKRVALVDRTVMMEVVCSYWDKNICGLSPAHWLHVNAYTVSQMRHFCSD